MTPSARSWPTSPYRGRDDRGSPAARRWGSGAPPPSDVIRVARPTRQGWVVLMCAVATGLMGRVFGVLELYFLAAALGVAAIAGWLTVTLRRPRVTVRRWVRPEVLTAGDTGRVDVLVRANGSASPFNWRPSFQLVEAVGDDRTARMSVAP